VPPELAAVGFKRAAYSEIRKGGVIVPLTAEVYAKAAQQALPRFERDLAVAERVGHTHIAEYAAAQIKLCREHIARYQALQVAMGIVNCRIG
jgi:hypothetical protein